MDSKEILRRAYRKRQYNRIWGLADYRKHNPEIAHIGFGFQREFGPGKSPFIVRDAIVWYDEAYVLVDGRNFLKEKWQRKLRYIFGVSTIHFYNTDDGETEMFDDKTKTFRRRWLSGSTPDSIQKVPAY